MQNDKDSNAPRINQRVLDLLAAASIFPKRIDGTTVEWQRAPAMQGDESAYAFVTNGPLSADGLLWMTIVDAVYSAGLAAGEESLRRDLRRLLGVRDDK